MDNKGKKVRKLSLFRTRRPEMEEESKNTSEKNTLIDTEIKTLGKESAIYGIANVVSRFLNFLLTPFYTHFLPTGEYGIVAGVYSYIAFINIVYHYALDQAYQQYFNNRELAFSAAIKCQIGTTALLTFVLCAFAPFWADLGGIAVKYVYFASAILVLDTVLIIPFADLQMRHKAKKFALIKSLSIIFNIALIVIFIGVLKWSIDAIFWANIAQSILQIIFVLPEFRIFSFRKQPGTEEILKKMLQYAWPLFFAEAGIMVVQIFDRPIMLKTLGESAVGIYQAAVKLGIFMQLLVNMFDTAWKPFILGRRKNKYSREDTVQLFSKIFTYFIAFSLAAWIMLSFFIGDIVQVRIFGKSLFGPKYWGALDLLPMFFGAFVLHGVYVNLKASIIITQKSEISAIVAITSSLISLAGNYLLIPRLGMLGGAIMLMTSYAIMCIMMYLFSRKIYPIPYQWKKVMLLCLAAAICFIPGYLYKGAFAIPVKIICTVLYPVAIWNIGFFSEEEKQTITGYFERRFSRFLPKK